MKPSGATRSAYAVALLPVRSVASAGSQGSFRLNGALSNVISFGATSGAWYPVGVPTGCGLATVPCGPSHGVNVPVTVAGMDVLPGEIVHMDENGACKFPADRLEAVLVAARALQRDEEARMAACLKAKSAAEIRAIFGGHSYAESDKE